MNYKKILLILVLALFTFGLVACDDPDSIDEWEVLYYTNQTTLERDYTGKDFFQDGIGVVTLVSAGDGDTAVFKTATSDPFRVRFLGIDTPESTYRIDPWGKAATIFTTAKLLNATTIVLEAEGSTPEIDSTGSRYLGWVWVDGKLLNLEIVEESYSTAKGVSGSRYQDVFFDADLRTQTKGLRIWGERDPDFDYSKEGIQITLEELRTNESEYLGRKIAVTGIVTRLIGFSAFIEDCSGENGCFGIYVYAGYTRLPKLLVGNKIIVDGSMVYFPDVETGAPQITDTNDRKITIISTGNEVTPTVFTIDQLDKAITTNLSGRFVKLENVTVVSGYNTSTSNAFTIRVKDAQNREIEIRINDEVAIRDPQNVRITDWNYFNGKSIDIMGPVSIYNNQYQLLLSAYADITFHN
jgi:micrococcal nuclease